MTTEVICESGGERLDVFLASYLEGLTRSAAQKLIEAGRVTLAGAPARKNHRTAAGEAFTVTRDPPEDTAAAAQDIPLVIMYEDDDVVVVDKPRGMVVHPAPGHPDGTLVNALLSHCGGTLSGIGGVKRPGIIHRIDKDTSGLILAAKNDRAHLSLAGQLASRTLTREYDAVVLGAFKEATGAGAAVGTGAANGAGAAVGASPDVRAAAGSDTDSARPFGSRADDTRPGSARVYGTIDAPIGRHPRDRKRQAVTDKNSRQAITHYEVIAAYKGYAHVRCRLETGRTHQIRVHMAYIGHPILGDTVYGRKKPELGLTGQCLHARKLKFIHPATARPMEIVAELPEYFVNVLARMG